MKQGKVGIEFEMGRAELEALGPLTGLEVAPLSMPEKLGKPGHSLDQKDQYTLNKDGLFVLWK